MFEFNLDKIDLETSATLHSTFESIAEVGKEVSKAVEENKFILGIEDNIRGTNIIEGTDSVQRQITYYNTPTPGPIIPREAIPIAPGTFTVPISGKYRVSSEFGPRRAPKKGASTNHGGIDLAAPIGTPVVAAGEGIVTVAAYNRGNAGHIIVIKHGSGYTTHYFHLNRFFVAAGARVVAGQQIAEVGNTGNSTGPHLHFEFRDSNNRKINPRNFLNF